MNRNQIKRAAAVILVPPALPPWFLLVGWTIHEIWPSDAPDNLFFHTAFGFLITTAVALVLTIVSGVFLEVKKWVQSAPEPEQPEAPPSVSMPQDEIRRYR